MQISKPFVQRKSTPRPPYPVSFLPRCPPSPKTASGFDLSLQLTVSTHISMHIHHVEIHIIRGVGAAPYLDGELALGEVNAALLGLLQHAGLLIG